ncbi:hypothetical protein JQX13_30585 [Archangium violaceum]|uniref:hypothetical protein n=1 Tax=Archangium violaceum TaxID=83451 RepID=UPI00193B9328|nr:hypothetical protein [Archangium violaceum]QRK04586.1 hypothetical protein JQX13_30585 [Archangium violaceum]
MTAINGSSSARSASVANTTTLSPAEATNAWQTELNNDVTERGKLPTDSWQYLNPERTAAYKAKVSEDMTRFLKQNPNATEAEIKKAANESIKKHSTHEVLGKMEFEYFLKKMTSRSQELSQDMWK